MRSPPVRDDDELRVDADGVVVAQELEDRRLLLLARGDRSKELELLVLRHEPSILRRQARRPHPAESDRLVLAALSQVLDRLWVGSTPAASIQDPFSVPST